MAVHKGQCLWQVRFPQLPSERELDGVWSELCSDPPPLILAIAGHYQRHQLTADQQRLLTHGLAHAAQHTGAWLVTGTEHTVLTKIVDEALKGHGVYTTKNDKRCVNGIEMVAFESDTRLAPRAHSDSDDLMAPRAGHVHFVLASRASDNQERTDITFRSRLLQHFSTKTDRRVPRVMLVVGGSQSTLQEVREAVEANIPVVLLVDTLGTAHLLAVLLSLSPHRSEVTETLATRVARQSSAHWAISILSDVMCCLKKRHLFQMCDLQGSASQPGDTIAAFLSPLLHCVLESKVPFTDQVKLAFRWNCVEVAKTRVFSPENVQRVGNQESELLKVVLLNALVEKDDFAEAVMDHCLKLDEFVTAENLYRLFHRCLDQASDEAALLGVIIRRKRTCVTCFRLCKSDKRPDKTDVFLKTLDQMLVDIIDDSRFCFYSWNYGSGRRDGTDGVKAAARALFLWAVLFNRQQLAKRFWKEGQDYIASALVAAVLLRNLSKRAETMQLLTLNHILQQQAEEWESRASGVLAECYFLHMSDTLKLLDKKLSGWGCEPAYQFTLLEMPYSLNTMKFISQTTAFQIKVTHMWKNEPDSDPQRSKNPESPSVDSNLSGCPTEKHKAQSYSPNRGSNAEAHRMDCWQPLHSRFRYLCSLDFKFRISLVSYVAFLVLVSLVVLTNLKENPGLLEFVVHVWMVCFITEDLRLLSLGTQLTVKYQILKWVQRRYKVDIVMYQAYLHYVVLRLTDMDRAFQLALGMFSVVVILAYQGLMRFFFFWKHMGTMVVVIKKMWRDFFQLLLISFIVIVAFGVAYVVQLYPQETRKPISPIFYLPLMQVFGNLQLEYFRGDYNSKLLNVENCAANYTELEQDKTLVELCPTRNGMVSWFLLVFIVLANLIVLNLLIAQMSLSFEMVQKDADAVWRQSRFQLAMEYRQRCMLPAPLTPLCYLYSAIRPAICHLYSAICHCKTPCRPGHSDDTFTLEEVGMDMYVHKFLESTESMKKGED